MTTMFKAGAAALTVLAAATVLATPSEAGCRWCGPAAAGFVAGAAVGAIASNSYYYGPRYYGGYYGGPGYAYYGPGYGAYAYAPGPRYYGYRYGYRYSPRSSGSSIQDR
jgi:hypothetical protein